MSDRAAIPSSVSKVLPEDDNKRASGGGVNDISSENYVCCNGIVLEHTCTLLTLRSYKDEVLGLTKRSINVHYKTKQTDMMVGFCNLM